MNRRLTIRAAFSALVLLAPAGALAVEATPQRSIDVPCAIVEGLAGDVEILDSSRTHLVDATKKAGIPCGGWVSIGAGWAELRHRDGYGIHVGSNTFVELPESNTDGHDSGDQLIVYRGQVYARSGDGSPELRVITANGRARQESGAMIVVFDHGEQETQLISLQGKARLENRFEISRKVVVGAGEASQLDFKLLRVVPSLPKVVSVASLRPKLADLHVEGKEESTAIASAVSRRERTMATNLVETADNDDGREADEGKPAGQTAAKKAPARKLASDYSGPKENEITYERNRTDAESAKLRKHWVKKMVAGQDVGEQILFPDKYYGKRQRVKVQVEDPAEKLDLKEQKTEKEEKKKLIEELSQIRED